METKEVLAVIGNTDCTEGRGKSFVKAYCETSGTAQRLAHKGYIQGSDCPIEKRTLYKPGGETSWFGPVTIERPNDGDLKRQVGLDEQAAALRRAREVGLTDDEIKLIKSASL